VRALETDTSGAHAQVLETNTLHGLGFKEARSISFSVQGALSAGLGSPADFDDNFPSCSDDGLNRGRIVKTCNHTKTSTSEIGRRSSAERDVL